MVPLGVALTLSAYFLATADGEAARIRHAVCDGDGDGKPDFFLTDGCRSGWEVFEFQPLTAVLSMTGVDRDVGRCIESGFGVQFAATWV